jgi:hypothetical protein
VKDKICSKICSVKSNSFPQIVRIFDQGLALLSPDPAYMTSSRQRIRNMVTAPTLIAPNAVLLHGNFTTNVRIGSQWR